MKLPQEILNQYDLSGVEIETLSGGIIHRTWKVVAAEGAFILQKVNPIYTPAVMEDIDAVTHYLSSKGCKTMEILKTKNNELCVDDENGFWRMFTYVDGKMYSEVKDIEIAREAGRLLGKYHRLLADLPYEFKHVRGIKNNIPALFEAYKNAVAGTTEEEILVLTPIIDDMMKLNLPDHLRKTVNHGDPKISNLIFGGEDFREALSMVDLDDCNRSYNVLFELGSALRSWSWDTNNLSEPFNLSQFQAAIEGYAQGSENFLTEEELQLIPQALKLNLLQLSSRFVRDYFEDSYFTWDPSKFPSRKAHNLARAREHLDLYKAICDKDVEMAAIVANILKSK